MTAATITKVLKKVGNNTNGYSLGFVRLTALPVRVRRDINLSCVLSGEKNDNSIKEFFNSMTEEEFVNWMKLA